MINFINNDSEIVLKRKKGIEEQLDFLLFLYTFKSFLEGLNKGFFDYISPLSLNSGVLLESQ